MTSRSVKDNPQISSRGPKRTHIPIHRKNMSFQVLSYIIYIFNLSIVKLVCVWIFCHFNCDYELRENIFHLPTPERNALNMCSHAYQSLNKACVKVSVPCTSTKLLVFTSLPASGHVPPLWVICLRHQPLVFIIVCVLALCSAPRTFKSKDAWFRTCL